MPREAKLFTSSAGSAVRGYLKFRANIPPRWIENARGTRKRMRARDCRGLPFAQAFAGSQTTGTSRDSERAE